MAVAGEEAVAMGTLAHGGRGVCAYALETGAAAAFLGAAAIALEAVAGGGDAHDGGAGAGFHFAVFEDVAAGVVEANGFHAQGEVDAAAHC